MMEQIKIAKARLDEALNKLSSILLNGTALDAMAEGKMLIRLANIELSKAEQAIKENYIEKTPDEPVDAEGPRDCDMAAIVDTQADAPAGTLSVVVPRPPCKEGS